MRDQDLKSTFQSERKSRRWPIIAIILSIPLFAGGAYAALEKQRQSRMELCEVEGAFTAMVLRMQYGELGGVRREEAFELLKTHPPGYMSTEDVEAKRDIFDRSFERGRDHYHAMLPMWKEAYFRDPNHDTGWDMAANVSEHTYLACLYKSQGWGRSSF